MIVFLDDTCSLILHCCSLFDKYDSNHFNSMLEMPKRIFILFRRMPRFIESSNRTFSSVFETCWTERKKMPSGVGVRYLYQPGELESGQRCATDPIWSLKVYRLGRSVTKPNEPSERSTSIPWRSGLFSSRASLYCS